MAFRRPISAFIAAEFVAMALTGCGTTPVASLGVQNVASAAKGASVAKAAPPAVAAPAKLAPRVTVRPGLLAQDYDPAATYTAPAAEAVEAKELETAVRAEYAAQGGGGVVGPVGPNWGLIGGGIGAGLVGGSLIGYAIYTGMIGSKDLLFPQDKEDMVKKPDAYGWAYEPVRFDGHDGTDLVGWYVPAAQPTTKAVLLLHGHTSNKDRFFQKYAGWLHADYNLFIYDSRFHGESEGTITTLGWHERRDAASALDQVKSRGNTSIGVMGESMGGAVAIGVAQDRPEIKAVWSDCAFDSLHDAIAPRAVARKYPMPNYVAWSVVKTASIRAKHNVASADPIKAVASIAPRPLYLVHGQADDDTTPMNSDKLYDKAGHPKTIWRVPGADHAQSWEKAPAEYQQRLTTFFGAAL